LKNDVISSVRKPYCALVLELELRLGKGVARGGPASLSNRNVATYRQELIMKKFQSFWLNFSRDMYKMHYLNNKFSNIAKCLLPLTFDVGDLKLRDFSKLCFFKLIMTKSNFKKSVKTSL